MSKNAQIILICIVVFILSFIGCNIVVAFIDSMAKFSGWWL